MLGLIWNVQKKNKRIIEFGSFVYESGSTVLLSSSFPAVMF